MNNKNESFGIPEVLQSLREDLDIAQQQLADLGKGAIMEVNTVDVEFTVALTGANEAGGKVGFSVLGVNFGGNASVKRTLQNTHKIKLSLKPIAGQKLAALGSGPKD